MSILIRIVLGIVVSLSIASILVTGLWLLFNHANWILIGLFGSLMTWFVLTGAYHFGDRLIKFWKDLHK